MQFSSEKKQDNAKLVSTVQYGRAVFENNIEKALAIVPKKVLDISKQTLDKVGILTQWFKHYDRVYLSIYWPTEKKGLIFPFTKEDKDLVWLIAEKKSLAIGNSKKSKKLLILDIPKDDPLKWIKNRIF